jgi:hypothetical protein
MKHNKKTSKKFTAAGYISFLIYERIEELILRGIIKYNIKNVCLNNELKEEIDWIVFNAIETERHVFEHEESEKTWRENNSEWLNEMKEGRARYNGGIIEDYEDIEDYAYTIANIEYEKARKKAIDGNAYMYDLEKSKHDLMRLKNEAS